MAENQRPRTSSIVGSLQIFRRTPVSVDVQKHNQSLIEQGSIQQEKTSLIKPSPHASNNNSKKLWRHVSLPLPVKATNKEEREERNRTQTRPLNFHFPRLSLPLKRNQTATMSRPYSRIPTPTKPPQGAAYSQTVYQDEGRRSMFSSLGRRNTILQPRTTSGKKQQSNDDSNNDMERKKTLSDSKIQENKDREHGPCSHPGPRTAAVISSYVARQTRREDIQNSRITHRAVQDTIPRSHTMLPVRETTAEPSSLGLDIPEQPRYQRRRSLPPYSYSRQRPTQTQTQIQGGLNALASRDSAGISRPRAEDVGSQTHGQFEEYEKRESMRNARVRASTGAISSNSSVPPLSETNRLSGGIFAPSRLSRSNNSSESLATRERNRKLERAERMAHRASINNIKTYTPSPSNMLDENEPLEYRSNPQQRLSRSPTRYLHQVAHPQPRQYWLGRFVTLVNAFHYEDSFHQPDAATGFGMISSYSRPLGSAERSLPDYRIKRAFMVLENACVTDEANKSLREFQDEYVSIHGDRWMI